MSMNPVSAENVESTKNKSKTLKSGSGREGQIGIDTECHTYHPIIPPVVIGIGMTRKIDYIILC